MFRRYGVREAYCVSDAAGDDDGPVVFERGLRDLFPLQLFDPDADLFGYCAANIRESVIRTADASSFMFCLAQHVGSGKRRPGRLIGNDEDLAWSCNHIDVSDAEHHLLCGCHIDVARTDDLVDLRDTGSTVGKGCDCLGRRRSCRPRPRRASQLLP